MVDIVKKKPVVLIVFNRPDTTRRVFAAISKARPSQLFLVCDGARVSRPGEAQRVAEVQSILEEIDWPCTVHRNYSDRNLGCRERVVSGLDWVFEQVPEAIVIEDDCLPSSSFFTFCATMLDRYRQDAKVFAVSGTSFVPPGYSPGHYFSDYALMWGWATWRDRWLHYRVQPEDVRRVLIRKWWRRPLVLAHWDRIFFELKNRPIDTWDYQWILTLWRHGALACRPTVNLVENIGFGPDASHTKDSNSRVTRNGIPEGKVDCSVAAGPMEADRKKDSVDEREWALMSLRSLAYLYLPWLRRFGRSARQ